MGSGGTTLGANWFIQSGIPQSTTFRFSGFPVFPNGRNDLGRSPTISQLDLNINQEIPLPGHSRLNLQANIDNMNALIRGYTGTMRTNPFYTTPNVYQGRREIRLQARLTF